MPNHTDNKQQINVEMILNARFIDLRSKHNSIKAPLSLFYQAGIHLLSYRYHSFTTAVVRSSHGREKKLPRLWEEATTTVEN